jgi:hypothetical protein
METIGIGYRFAFPNGSEEIFNLQIDSKSLRLITPLQNPLPAWTELGFCQCPNCPLAVEQIASCPMAVNLMDVVARFDRLLSYDKTLVTVTTKERRVSQATTVQRGLSSLLGLVIATSGCPWTDFFKPMARFHLPFSNMEETIWRAASTYLLACYFRGRKEPSLEFSIKNLTRIYKEIQTVNLSLAERLRAACKRDSMLNALILLDMLAKCIPPVVEGSLESIRHYFDPLLTSRCLAL